ncbi:MAG TPA: hypothetical protein ENJ65_00390, partial [Candidatus Tenderia electrophaga]|nr:hypothetical protein [Candidatus Tenderia electrophaga]
MIQIKHKKRSLSAALVALLPLAAYAQSDDALLQRIEAMEQRIIELETTTVLSDPETSVKRIEVFVDENGLEHDTEVAGSRRIVTYQRERVFRRQTINEKIEEALADAESRSVQLGV